MDRTKKVDKGSKKINKSKAFTVPFTLDEIQKNINFSTRSKNSDSKEEIMQKAFRYHSQGNLLEATKYYQKFIDQGFKDHKVFSNYGNILKDDGNREEAELLYRKAIDINPKFSIAYYNLGNILKDLGRLDEAELSLRKAIKLNPNFAEGYDNLGNILKDLGRLDQAELSLRKAIELNPNFANAYMNLGGLLRDLNKLQEAEMLTKKAIILNPTSAFCHLNLGCILSDLNKLKEAESSLRKAIKLKPNLAEAHYNLGNTLRDIGKIKEAESSFNKAIELNKNFLEAYTNVGNLLYNSGKLKEAKSLHLQAIKLNPNFSIAYSNLGHMYKDSGNFNDAIKLYKQTLKVDKNSSSAKFGLITSKANICDWSEQNTQNNWLKTLGIVGSAVNPWDLFSLEDNPLKHLKRSRNLYKEKYVREESKITINRKKKIHVGYFSSDFRAHPTMYLINSIFKLHDKSKFNIYLYSFTPKEDEITNLVKNSGCIFRDIRELNYEEASELARNDNLDIAIDLNGYIKHNRMSIFSYRVAAIQINYLGYPGTVGADTIDYILADNIIIPTEYEMFYSEKIIRMPNCYQCNDNQKDISKRTISRKDHKLPDKGFVFTCFNNNYKITQREFNIWMRLLKMKSGSVLWLYKSNQWSMKNLHKEAVKRNVDPKRLIFADRIPLKDHLRRHCLGDLAIDTFNCNGHTTTSDALWAGLPVLTKLGESFAARVSASLLNSIGIPELITFSEKEYEEKALYIANNPLELRRLKSKLAKSRDKSSVFNSELFTRNLENKFNELVRNQ